jgi:hypothetical protein
MRVGVLHVRSGLPGVGRALEAFRCVRCGGVVQPARAGWTTYRHYAGNSAGLCEAVEGKGGGLPRRQRYGVGRRGNG